MSRMSTSIGMMRISVTWLVTVYSVKKAEQVIQNDPVDLGMEIVKDEERHLNLGATAKDRILLVVTTWRGNRGVRVVTAFEPIKRLIQFYYRERKG